MLVARHRTTGLVQRTLIQNRPFFSKMRGPVEEPTDKDGNKLSPEEAQRQAADLVMQSMKDVGALFSLSPDSEVQPIDTKPIWEDPTLFAPLSILHQGQVTDELQEKFDGKWTKLTKKDKLLGYYIAYGNWGVREKFDNWNTLEPPLDLPFTIPSLIKLSSPSPSAIIKKLDPVILSETPVRIPQFNYKRMDIVTKFFIYLSIIIILSAVYRDYAIGEAGKPHEEFIEDPYEIERAARHEREAEEELKLLQEQEQKAQISNRKWYYLWLK